MSSMSAKVIFCGRSDSPDKLRQQNALTDGVCNGSMAATKKHGTKIWLRLFGAPMAHSRRLAPSPIQPPSGPDRGPSFPERGPRRGGMKATAFHVLELRL